MGKPASPVCRLAGLHYTEGLNEFGFDRLIFTFADGIEGVLAPGHESHFMHIHGGPYEVLVANKGVLAGKVFSLLAPTPEEQLRRAWPCGD